MATSSDPSRDWRWWIGLPLRLLGWLLILPVRFYQLTIRRLLPPLCRYRPGCSTFMIEAIQKRGPLWGVVLGSFRLLRCQPLGSCGFDPVEAWPPWRINGRVRWRLTADERTAILAVAHTELCEKLAAAGDHQGLAMVGGWAWLPEGSTTLPAADADPPGEPRVSAPGEAPPGTAQSRVSADQQDRTDSSQLPLRGLTPPARLDESGEPGSGGTP